MRHVVHTRAGQVIASAIVAVATGAGIWLGTWGFHGHTVELIAPATATGTVTLSAACPPGCSSVTFTVDGGDVGTASTKPFSLSWDSSTVLDGTHTVVAEARGPAGEVDSPPTTVTTSNGASANFFVSPTGSDANPGTSGSPFLTFEKCYSVAAQGQVCGIEPGTYQAQTLTYDATKTSAAGNCRLVYNNNGTFSTSAAGCVTFEPVGGAVTIGCKTQTTAAIDMTSSSTIPVVSTAGCPTVPGSSTYSVHMNGTFTCTGIDATDFTGCTPSGGCFESSGATLCHYLTGATVMVAGLNVTGASYLRFRNIAVSNVFSVDHDGSSHNVTDVIADGLTASWGFARGSNVWYENGVTGDNNVGSQNFKWSSCDFCGVYNTISRNASEATCPLAQHADCHSEDIYLDTETHFYLVGSTLYGAGSSANLFFSYGSSGNPGPVTLVNNYFGTPCSSDGACGNEVQINAQNNTLDSYTIEGNSSSAPWQFLNDGGTNAYTNWNVQGNLGIGMPCSPPFSGAYGGAGSTTVSMAYNVDSGTACSSASNPVASNNVGGVSISGLFVNPLVGDLDLAGSTQAWENTWASCPLTVDLHQTARPGTCTPGGDQR